jgi:hypothetical protein
MGERFLILEETADALDVIDPELAVQFRVVNGLPAREEMAVGANAPASAEPMSPASRHEIRMDVGDLQIRCACACGAWLSAVDWDDIDTMVAQIRGHLGSVRGTSDDGITAAATSLTLSEKRVG